MEEVIRQRIQSKVLFIILFDVLCNYCGALGEVNCSVTSIGCKERCFRPEKCSQAKLGRIQGEQFNSDLGGCCVYEY